MSFFFKSTQANTIAWKVKMNLKKIVPKWVTKPFDVDQKTRIFIEMLIASSFFFVNRRKNVKKIPDANNCVWQLTMEKMLVPAERDLCCMKINTSRISLHNRQKQNLNFVFFSFFQLHRYRWMSVYNRSSLFAKVHKYDW